MHVSSLCKFAQGVHTTMTDARLQPSMEFALTSWHISSTTGSGIRSSNSPHRTPASCAAASGSLK